MCARLNKGFAITENMNYQGFGMGFSLCPIYQGNRRFQPTLYMKQITGNGSKSLSISEMLAKHKHVQSRRKKTRTEVPLSLGQLIQNYRERTGISLRGLAKQLGVSLTMVALAERDKTFPQGRNLNKIGDLLRVKPEELRKLDRRVPMDKLRRLLDKSPQLNGAFRYMVTQIEEGNASPESFARALLSAGPKG